MLIPLFTKEITKLNQVTNRYKNIEELPVTRVRRWMSEEEYKKMLEIGKVQMCQQDIIHVANLADIKAFNVAKIGSVYVEFDIDSSFISAGRNEK